MRAVIRPLDANSAAVLARTLEDEGEDGEGEDPEADATAPAPELMAEAAEKVSPPTACGYLRKNQGLSKNQTLRSCNGAYRLIMQSDGNLVAYVGRRVVWASNTKGKGGDHVIMQSDGNLVIYPPKGRAVWATNTNGHPGAYFRLQNDANLVVYQGSKVLVVAEHLLRWQVRGHLRPLEMRVPRGRLAGPRVPRGGKSGRGVLLDRHPPREDR